MANIFTSPKEEIGDGILARKDRVSYLKTAFANNISVTALEAVTPSMPLTNIIRVLMSITMGSRDLDEFEIRIGEPNDDDEIVGGYYDIMQTGFLVEKEPVIFTSLKAGEVGTIELRTPALAFMQIWAQTKVGTGEISTTVNAFYAR